MSAMEGPSDVAIDASFQAPNCIGISTNASSGEMGKAPSALPAVNADTSSTIEELPSQVVESSVQAQFVQWAQTAADTSGSPDVLHQLPNGSVVPVLDQPPAEPLLPGGKNVLPQLGQFPSLAPNQPISFPCQLDSKLQSLDKHNFSMPHPNSTVFAPLCSPGQDLNSHKIEFQFSSLSLPVFGVNNTPNGSLNPVGPENINISSINEVMPSVNVNMTTSMVNNIIPPKTFAQAASPAVVSDSIPNKGSAPECGLLVERLKGVSLDDYARSIEAVAGKKTLVFIGQYPQDNDYVLAFLERPALVTSVVALGIVVKRKWLCVTHMRAPACKLIISDVMPYIPDSLIIEACSTFGNSVYHQLRRIPSSVKANEFHQVLSFRRELLIVVDKNKAIPDSVVVLSHGEVHTLKIAPQGLICFRCKRSGHKAQHCKAPFQVYETPSKPDNGNISLGTKTKIQTPLQNVAIVNKSTKEHPKINKHSLPIGYSYVADNLAKESHTSITKDNSTPPAADVDAWRPPPSATALNSEWHVVGRKGKVSYQPVLNKPTQSVRKAKLLKAQPNTDVASFRPFSIDRDSSPELTTGRDNINSFNSRSTDSRARKIPKVMNATLPMEVTMSQPLPSSVPEVQPTLSSSAPDEHLGKCKLIAQLQKLQASRRNKNSGSPPLELTKAQAPVEELLQSIWNVRGAKRRAMLECLLEKDSNLLHHIDTVLASIPPVGFSHHVFKYLTNAKQELRLIGVSDPESSMVDQLSHQ